LQIEDCLEVEVEDQVQDLLQLVLEDQEAAVAED
jgi:hypothetical protein